MGVRRKLSFPKKDLATSLIEVYGDIKSKVCGENFEARWVAGPLPIDLPNTIMSCSFTPT